MLKDLHRRTTKRQLACRLADHLLSDLLVVVGGVESSFQRLVALLDVVQAWSDEHVRPQMKPGAPQDLSNPEVTEAWYEFANLLYWTRGVEERLRRKPFGRPYQGLRDQGLIPALRPERLRKRVTRLHDDLIAGPVGEVRAFANLSLHAALVRHSYSGAEVEESTGRVRLRCRIELRARSTTGTCSHGPTIVTRSSSPRNCGAPSRRSWMGCSTPSISRSPADCKGPSRNHPLGEAGCPSCQPVVSLVTTEATTGLGAEELRQRRHEVLGAQPLRYSDGSTSGHRRAAPAPRPQ